MTCSTRMGEAGVEKRRKEAGTGAPLNETTGETGAEGEEGVGEELLRPGLGAFGGGAPEAITCNRTWMASFAA